MEIKKKMIKQKYNQQS